MTYIGRKPCPGCPGLRPPYPPCCCIGVPDYGTQTLPASPPWQPTYTPLPVTVPSIPVTPAARGCICPPTSEQTCQSPVCPRKPAPSPPGSGEAKAPLTMCEHSDPRVSQSAAFLTPAESNLQKVQIPTSTIPEGFIPWHGGECPVAEGTVVDYVMRGRCVVHESAAKNLRWNHLNEDEKRYTDDIIAYRIHKPADFRLEAGKFYVTASGERVGPMHEEALGVFDTPHCQRAWLADGRMIRGLPSENHILALSSNQESVHD